MSAFKIGDTVKVSDAPAVTGPGLDDDGTLYSDGWVAPVYAGVTAQVLDTADEWGNYYVKSDDLGFGQWVHVDHLTAA